MKDAKHFPFVTPKSKLMPRCWKMLNIFGPAYATLIEVASAFQASICADANPDCVQDNQPGARHLRHQVGALTHTDDVPHRALLALIETCCAIWPTLRDRLNQCGPQA